MSVPDNYTDAQKYIRQIGGIANDRALRLLPHMVGGSRQAAIAQVGEAVYFALLGVATKLLSEERAITLPEFDSFRSSVRTVVKDIGSLEELAVRYCGLVDPRKLG